MRGDPTRPESWLARARSNLARAELGRQDPAIFYEDLCYDAQQAAEKVLKAILVHKQVDFPKTHSLGQLMDLLEEAGVGVPAEVRQADLLSQYAVETRYPYPDEEVDEGRYRAAVVIARRLVEWAVQTIETTPGEAH